MSGLCQGRGGLRVWDCLREHVEAPQQQMPCPCLSPLPHPPVGCPACSWVPDGRGRPLPFPLKAGLLVAVPRPLRAVRVHGALSP